MLPAHIADKTNVYAGAAFARRILLIFLLFFRGFFVNNMGPGFCNAQLRIKV
jgi:hypothetical protein